MIWLKKALVIHGLRLRILKNKFRRQIKENSSTAVEVSQLLLALVAISGILIQLKPDHQFAKHYVPFRRAQRN